MTYLHSVWRWLRRRPIVLPGYGVGEADERYWLQRGQQGFMRTHNNKQGQVKMQIKSCILAGTVASALVACGSLDTLVSPEDLTSASLSPVTTEEAFASNASDLVPENSDELPLGLALVSQGTLARPKRHRCRVVVSDPSETDVTCHVREGAHIDVTDSADARHRHTFVDDNVVGRTVREHTLFPGAAQTVTVHEYEDDRHVARAKWKGGRHVRHTFPVVTTTFTVGGGREWSFPRAKDVTWIRFRDGDDVITVGNGLRGSYNVRRYLERDYTNCVRRGTGTQKKCLEWGNKLLVDVHDNGLDADQYIAARMQGIKFTLIISRLGNSTLMYHANGQVEVNNVNGHSYTPTAQPVSEIELWYLPPDSVSVEPATFHIDWDGTTVEGGVHLKVGLTKQPPAFGTDFRIWSSSSITSMVTERCGAAPSRSVTLQPADFPSDRVRLQWRNDQGYGRTAKVTCAQINAGKQ